MPRGQKKQACSRGHVNPERSKSGACIACSRQRAKEYYYAHRDEQMAAAEARNKAFPDERRDYQRAWRFGVPVATIKAVLERSGGKCEACGTELAPNETCIDHNHDTGVIRGVLCKPCNSLEGLIFRQRDRMQKVAEYLKARE